MLLVWNGHGASQQMLQMAPHPSQKQFLDIDQHVFEDVHQPNHRGSWCMAALVSACYGQEWVKKQLRQETLWDNWKMPSSRLRVLKQCCEPHLGLRASSIIECVSWSWTCHLTFPGFNILASDLEMIALTLWTCSKDPNALVHSKHLINDYGAWTHCVFPLPRVWQRRRDGDVIGSSRAMTVVHLAEKAGNN